MKCDTLKMIVLEKFMVFMRKSLWTMWVLIALSYQSVQAMDEADIEKNPITSLTATSLAATPSTAPFFGRDLPDLALAEIIKSAFISAKTETTNFQDIGRRLASVDKRWREIIKTNSRVWVCEYYNIEEENRGDFWFIF